MQEGRFSHGKRLNVKMDQSYDPSNQLLLLLLLLPNNGIRSFFLEQPMFLSSRTPSFYKRAPALSINLAEEKSLPEAWSDICSVIRSGTELLSY